MADLLVPSLGVDPGLSRVHVGLQGLHEGAGIQPEVQEGSAGSDSLGALVLRDGSAGAMAIGVAVGLALSGGRRHGS
jgi:hypothetical protein